MNWVKDIFVQNGVSEDEILKYTGIDVKNAGEKFEVDDGIIYAIRPSYCFHGETFFQTFRETASGNCILIETGIPDLSYIGVDTLEELEWNVPEEWEELISALLCMKKENLKKAGRTTGGFSAFC